MEGVTNEVPVLSEVPPEGALNQEMVPADAAAPKVTVPGPQIAFGVVPVMVGAVFTVASTAERAEVQVPSEVCT